MFAYLSGFFILETTIMVSTNSSQFALKVVAYLFGMNRKWLLCCLYSEMSSKYYMHIKLNETMPPPRILQSAGTKSEQIGIERVKTEHGMAAWGLFLKSYEQYPYTDDSHTRFPYKDEKRYS